MVANEVLSSNMSTSTEEVDSALADENLAAPKKWRYDAKEGKLYMMLEGRTPTLLISRAILEESRGLFRLATLENGRRVILWTSNRTGALSAF